MAKYRVLFLITALSVSVNAAVATAQFAQAPASAVINDKAKGKLLLGDKSIK